MGLLSNVSEVSEAFCFFFFFLGGGGTNLTKKTAETSLKSTD